MWCCRDSGVVGSGDGSLLNPSCVSVTYGSDWVILVADQDNHRIVAYTKGGTFMRWWGTGWPHPLDARPAPEPWPTRSKGGGPQEAPGSVS